MKQQGRYRWFVVAVMFLFMLLHQSDKLLIGPLTTPIMEHFGINEAQMGFVFTGALIVGAVMYPLWGYLYDRFARSKLLALASFLWGSTTWLSAVAPTFPTFVAARATTGIDDSSYPGLFSLIADYFSPEVRSKINGFLQLSMPLGYLMGMILALMLKDSVGWRGVFYITGALGIALAFVIYFGVKEPPRGQSEPEMEDLEQTGTYRFDWQIAKGLFRKKSLILLFMQGFFGVFPWQVITYWFFRYLETERSYDTDAVMMTMIAAILAMSAGYMVGGTLGDALFKRSRRGRVLLAAFGVLMGAIFLALAIFVPLDNMLLFGVLMAVAAFFMPFASPNVIATVFDITLPEVRSTALAIQYLMDSSGAALAPIMAGFIAVRFSLETAILVICTSTWIICAVLFTGVAFLIPNDIQTLRDQMSERAEAEVEAAVAG